MNVFAPFFAALKAIPAVMGALCLAAVVILPIMLVAALLKRSDQHGRDATGAEAEMMQELYLGLTRLESRVESLETLLLERERPRDGDKH